MRFTPTASKYAGEECQGVFMIVTDRARLRPVRVGIEIAALLHKLYREQVRARGAERLFGSRDASRPHPQRRRPGGDRGVLDRRRSRWRLMRAQYLLYR